jgi:hypothetical protein
VDVPGQLHQEQTDAVSGVGLTRDKALPVGCKRDLVVPPNISNFGELPPTSVEPYKSGWRDVGAIGSDEGVAVHGKRGERAKELEPRPESDRITHQTVVVEIEPLRKQGSLPPKQQVATRKDYRQPRLWQQASHLRGTDLAYKYASSRRAVALLRVQKPSPIR